MTAKREFDLTDDEIAYIDSKAATGGQDPSAVVRDAIRLLQDEDALVERWVAEKVIPAYDDWKKNPGQVYSTEEVSDRLKRRIHERAARKAS